MPEPGRARSPGTVRPAGPADIPELVRVINAAFQVEKFFVAGDRTTPEEVAARMERPGAGFLVAERSDGQGLAGGVYVELRGKIGFFAMLAVDPVLQGGGHGRALVEAIEAHFRAAGCEAIDIMVVNLRGELPAFYRRLGFVVTGEAPFTTPAKLLRPAHMVLMRKAVSRER